MSIRRAELVALGSTTVAFALTVLLAGSAYAVESNPLARALLDSLGWVGAGSLALLLEGMIFAGYRRLERSHELVARLGAGLVAAIGVADVLVNVWVLSVTGVPPTTSNGLLGAIAVVSLVALAVACRSPLANTVRKIPSPPRRAVLTLFVVFMAISGVTPINQITNGNGDVAVRNVSAEYTNGSDYWSDDFEDGTNSGFERGTVISESYKESYSLSVGTDFNNQTDVAVDIRNFKLTGRFRAPNGSVQVGIQNGTQYNADVELYRSTGDLRFIVRNASGASYEPVIPDAEFSTATWYNYALKADGDTYYAKVWEAGTPEPSTWDSTLTDGPVSQTATLHAYAPNSGHEIWLDQYKVGSLSGYKDAQSAGDSGYKQTIELDDRTERFVDHSPSLFVFKHKGEDAAAISSGPYANAEEWAYVDTYGFNWQNRTYPKLTDGETYALVVATGESDSLKPGGDVYHEIGYTAVDNGEIKTLEIGSNETECNEGASLRETSSGNYEVVYCGEPVDSFSYDLAGPDGTVYNDTLEFDSPTSYYEGEIDPNVTNTTNTGDVELDDYSGTYSENGTTFNASDYMTSPFGGGGPVGSGGSSSTATTVGGWALLAGGAFLAYRRFGDGQLEAALGAVGRQVSSLLGR